MPELSSWKMPSVSPAQSRSKVLTSSIGRVSMSRSLPISALMCLRALSMTVRVFRPRKSNLINPVISVCFMSYWVRVSSFDPRQTGRD